MEALGEVVAERGAGGEREETEFKVVDDRLGVSLFVDGPPPAPQGAPRGWGRGRGTADIGREKDRVLLVARGHHGNGLA